MTKAQIEHLQFELEKAKDECELMKAKEEVKEYIDRLVTIKSVNKAKEYVEKVYKEQMKTWGFLFGMRDNIVDMANNLADLQNVNELQYLQHVMYCMLLDCEPNATKGLHTTTDGMEKALLKHLKKEGVA